MRTVERSRTSPATRGAVAKAPQRTAVPARPAVRKPEPESGLEYWGRIFFHSIGVGVLALLLLMLAILVGVGVYGLIVWSLTGWDLASFNVHPYRPLATGTLWGVFAGGTGLGLWFFSGAAWRVIREAGRKRAAQPRRPKR